MAGKWLDGEYFAKLNAEIIVLFIKQIGEDWYI